MARDNRPLLAHMCATATRRMRAYPFLGQVCKKWKDLLNTEVARVSTACHLQSVM